MNINEKPIFTGELLKNKIAEGIESRPSLVEGLVYEDSILMLAAPPGVGKSMLSTQIMLQMSSGLPVFGHLHVERPLRCLYLQSERPISEIMERMKIMSINTNITYDNIVVDASLQGLDLMQHTHQVMALNRLQQIYNSIPFDVVFMDPIYAMVSGGLSKDEPSSSFCRFSATVQSTFKCTNILIHHTNRGVKDKDTGERMGKDFYGSTWLEAHVTGLYMISKTQNGTQLINKKNSHGNLIEKIELEYDLDTNLSNITESSLGKMPGIDRLMMYLRATKKSDIAVSVSEILSNTGLSRAQFYKLHETHSLKKCLQSDKSIGNKKLYKFTG